jgi:arylsulfatase A-like enzyme
MDTSKNRPNVILFMVDQLAAKWLEEAHDRTICALPNLSWLRDNGTTFTRAFTSNPVCSPARATIATGLCSRAHGLIMNGYALDPAVPTFMQALQAGGWRTGAFGKLHLRPHFESFAHDYRPYGFDVVHGTEDDRSGEWLDWVKREHPEQYVAALSTAWPDVPGYAHYGPDGVDLRPDIHAAKERFPHATGRWPESSAWAHPLPFPEELSQSSWITTRALDFIRDTGPDQPLFAHVSYVAPHPPFCPPAEFMDRVERERIPAPVVAEWLHEPESPEYFRKMARVLNNQSEQTPVWMSGLSITRDPDGGPARQKLSLGHERHCYFADITHLDEQLGRIRRALEAAGRLHDTCLVFTSDHGELLGDHGFWQKQERHYDGGIRVPLIIAGPGLQKNLTCAEIVQLEDLCPTILELAEVPIARLRFRNRQSNTDDTCASTSGRSLVELCRGNRPDRWREEAYVESYPYFGPETRGSWARTVRTARWRYTLYPDANGEQLFDLEADPDEQRNLANAPAHAALRGELRDRLMEQIIGQDSPVPPRDLFMFGIH